jgi:RNA polymerase sigma factor (sigma-70 family)
MIHLALWEKWRYNRTTSDFRQLLETHGDLVYRTCRRILNDSEQATEIALECFEVFVHDHGDDAPEKMIARLHTIAVNQSRTYLQMSDATLAEQLENIDVVSRPDIDTVLDEAFEDLPEELRTLLMCRFLLGKSTKEVARHLGISRRAVAARIREGITLLQRALENRGIIVAISVLTPFLECVNVPSAPASYFSALDQIALAQSPPASEQILTAKTLSLTAMVLIILGVFGAFAKGTSVHNPEPQQIESAPTSRLPIESKIQSDHIIIPL